MRKGLTVLFLFFVFFALLSAATVQVFDSDFYCSYIVLTKEPTSRIVSSTRVDYEVYMYSDGDYIILKGDFKEGEEYLVVKKIKKLKGHQTLYRKTGFIKIVKVQGKEAVAQIVHSCQYMAVGDYAIKYERKKPFEIQEPETEETLSPPSEFKASLLFLDSGFKQIGDRHWAVIDKGRAHGVREGDVFFIFRPLPETEVYKPIAKAVVIESYERASTVKIFSALDVVRLKDILFKKAEPKKKI